MILPETEALVVNLIISIAKEEKSLELLRQVLSEQPLFETYAAFQRIDRKYRGHITSNDIKHFIKYLHNLKIRENGIEVNEKQCFYVLKHYDHDQDCKLSFKEFLPILLPLNNSKLRDNVISRQPYEVSSKNKLSVDIEYPLVRVFVKELEMHANLENLKKELSLQNDFNILEAFKAIDINHSRYIDFENLEAYLLRKGIRPQEEDIISFIQRLDKDLDCKVSYMEFMEGILPAEPRARQMPKYQTPSKLSNRETCATSATKKKNNTNVTNKSFSTKSQAKMGIYTTPDKSLRSNYHNNKVHEFEVNRPVAIEKSPLKPILKKPSPYSKSNVSPPKTVQIVEQSTENIFQFMQKQIQYEKELENQKQSIAIKKEISLAAICSLFFMSQKEYVVPSDFLHSLSILEIKANLHEIHIIFDRFDRNMDGKLQYTDVCNIFLPKQPEYCAILKNRYCTTNDFESIGPEGKSLVKKLLQTYFDVEFANRKLKQKVSFHPKIAFEQCDLKDAGYFTQEDVIT